jgi:hypothetical protein
MRTFPPPEGHPASASPHPDPWREQARRDAAHRAERRRRRRRWLVALAVVVSIVVVSGGAVVLVARWASERDQASLADSSVAPTTTAEVLVEPTVPPGELVAVDEVWLVDRGEGVFDWGVVVGTPRFAPTRSGVEVQVRLIDADGGIVEELSGTVDGIGEESQGVVAGRLVDPNSDPVRIEFDVLVGVPSADIALGDLLEARALNREDDTLSGRVRSSATSDLNDLTMVLVWRDDADDVVAAVPVAVERVRPGVDARFEVQLFDEMVPEGRPDTVFWLR